jgi:segregation and condensation protein A
MVEPIPFAEDSGAKAQGGELVVDLEGFEGPIDLLLTLAREQKVDLTKISILALAEQYIAYIERARELRLEIAADYLVMAAWLAFLKSRLLLPQPEDQEEEPSAADMALAMTFQLQRLEAIQTAGIRLFARPKLGEQVFRRGAPEGIAAITTPVYELSLYELLKSYGHQRSRRESAHLKIAASELYSMDEALQRLRGSLGGATDWTTIEAFLPASLKFGLVARSALASTIAATLELARTGRLEIRQDVAFGPIFIRRTHTA